FVIALVIGGVFLWQHFKQPSDVQVSQMLTGTWFMTIDGASEYQIAIATDGSFVSHVSTSDGGASSQIEGTILVTNGMLVDTVTKTSDTNAHVPFVSYMKIYSMTDSELVFGKDGVTNKMVLHKH